MLGILTATYKVKVLLCCTSLFLISTLTFQESRIFYRFRSYPAGQQPRTILQVPRDVLESQALLTTGISRWRKSSHTQEELDTHIGRPYFRQAGDGDVLCHYDHRYFLGTPVTDEERRATLRYMIEAYTSIFRKHDLQTWIAHGTLLGFWWNAKILPWDMDIDVQVPEPVLYKLGDQYNMTKFQYELIEDQDQGTTRGSKRTYILDVNANIRERERGWGDNVIDARFIDTSNGLYIDITGISELPPEDADGDSNIWLDKNDHRYHEKDIWPLRETIFEGIVATIPAGYEAILTEEYGLHALMATKYHGHEWSRTQGRWVEDVEI